MRTAPTAPTAPTVLLPLPQRLRDATHALHRQTEQAGLMPQLLAGRLARPQFVRMQRQLHALYTALEAALDLRGAESGVGDALRHALRRAPALAGDLHALHGDGWAALPLCPALHTYVQRLRVLAARGRTELLAHVYVRYLGDLHGGQILQARVARMLGLVPGAAGTGFYGFGDAAQVGALRQAVRDTLAEAPLTPAEADAVVAEACWGFAQHARLFEELAAEPPTDRPARPPSP